MDCKYTSEYGIILSINENFYNLFNATYIDLYGHIPGGQETLEVLKTFIGTGFPTPEAAADGYFNFLSTEGMRIETLIDKINQDKNEDDDFCNLINEFEFEYFFCYRRNFPGPLVPVEGFFDLGANLKCTWGRFYECLAVILGKKCEVLGAFNRIAAERIDTDFNLFLTREILPDDVIKFTESTTALKNIMNAVVLALRSLKAEKQAALESKKERKAKLNKTKGNGLKGKKTSTMHEQLQLFRSYLSDNKGISHSKSFKREAYQFWSLHKKEFETASKAKGDNKGYKNPSSLAQAYRLTKN